MICLMICFVSHINLSITKITKDQATTNEKMIFNFKRPELCRCWSDFKEKSQISYFRRAEFRRHFHLEWKPSIQEELLLVHPVSRSWGGEQLGPLSWKGSCEKHREGGDEGDLRGSRMCWNWKGEEVVLDSFMHTHVRATDVRYTQYTAICLPHSSLRLCVNKIGAFFYLHSLYSRTPVPYIPVDDYSWGSPRCKFIPRRRKQH